MAGGVKGGIWAVVRDDEWAWVFGEPEWGSESLEFLPMEALPYRDAYVVKLDDGTQLEVTGLEITNDSGDVRKRIRRRPRPTDDKPFVGFDNLPEPEFKTGWDDFDWSK